MKLTQSEIERKADLIVEKLGCSLAEANDIVAHDKLVEGGADPYPLQKNGKSAERKVKTVSTGQRKRKPNEDKRELIDRIVNELSEYSPKILNPEREVEFTKGNVRYKLVLSVPRK
jgi:hypothetical protein